MQTHQSPQRRFLPFVLLAASLTIAAGAYSLALPGYWLFDDWPNLAQLIQVADIRTALQFMLAGDAGPLGRPVSLATFALQADAWDTRPEAMLAVNFGIHLLSMLAVFFLAAGLARIGLPQDALRARWIGAFVALLWGLAPFLATTHLMVIQRMTSLSALFLFAGLALFVWAHLTDRRNLRLAALVAGLGLGTLLATFSKENGALLPLLALAILVLWIPREQWLTGTVERLALGLLVLLPSLFILGYLGLGFIETLQRGDYGPRRDFTPVERLLTQPVILLDYLRQLLLPQAVAVTPFMDHIPPSRGWLEPPITLVAWLFWGTLVATAIALRRLAPWFVFGLGFFLLGHILESTHIGLELYFAHRNYVPAFGLFFALVYFALTVSPTHFRVGAGVLLTYALVLALVLFQVTTHWNDKHVNAELWLEYNPHSVRARQLLGWQQAGAGDFENARQTLDQASNQRPEFLVPQLQRTAICVDQEDSFPELLAEVKQALRTSPLYRPAVAMELNRTARQADPSPLCPPRTHAVLIRLADALLDNPRYGERSFTRSHLLLAKAYAYVEKGQPEAAVPLFKEAVRERPDIHAAFQAPALLANLGQYEEAYDFLDELETLTPDNPVEGRLWRQRLDAYRGLLETSEQIDRQEGRLEPADQAP